MSVAVKQQPLLRSTRHPRVYTVSFENSGTLGPGERLDAARGLVANVAVGGGTVRNDFDRIPIFQRPICNATWDKTERKWRDFVWQGEEGFSWSPTESYREVLYRCQPFWFKMDLSGTYAPASISVTDRPLAGFTLAPMFKNGRDFVYRPCFQAGVGEDGLLHSRAGLAPMIAEAAKLIDAVHAYDAHAHTETMGDLVSDWMLMVVEFANRRLQEVMSGKINGELQYSYLKELLPAGASLTGLCASSGEATSDGYSALAWRGKENAWGNATSYICDVLFRQVAENEYSVHHLPDLTQWTGAFHEGYVTSDKTMSFKNYTWATSLHADSERPWLIVPCSYAGQSRTGIGASLMGIGEECGLFASGHSYGTSGVSPLKFTLIRKMSGDRRGRGGARLVLEEE